MFGGIANPIVNLYDYVQYSENYGNVTGDHCVGGISGSAYCSRYNSNYRNYNWI